MQSSVRRFGPQLSLACASTGDRSKTIMCSVLFLDIVEYSKKPVSWQISLKERFNAYLSVAIRGVPIDDRIILDTGDGAAVSFLGDVENALQVALGMRAFLDEGMHKNPPLLMRMGINLGPVRLVRDINGRPSIVGDGINVAERVAEFSDPGQILVSRPYYDAVSRLSSEYAGMFLYQGARTDKQVREHEIYAVGHPEETAGAIAPPQDESKAASKLAIASQRLNGLWQKATAVLQKAWRPDRAAYAMAPFASVAADVALIAVLVILLLRPSAPPTEATAAAPASAVTPAAVLTQPPPKMAVAPDKPKLASGKGELAVSCAIGTTVFVDGRASGKIGKGPMVVHLDAGKHFVLLIHPTKSLVHAEHINVAEGKSLKVNAADFCGV